MMTGHPEKPPAPAEIGRLTVRYAAYRGVPRRTAAHRRVLRRTAAFGSLPSVALSSATRNQETCKMPE